MPVLDIGLISKCNILMAYSIKIDKEQKIILYKVYGEIKKQDVGIAWKKVFDLPEFSRMGYDILADYSEANFKFSISDTKVLDSVLNTSSSIVPGKKIAAIVNEPYITAITMIVQEMFHADLRYITKIFSTKEAAMKWLKL